MFPARIVEKAEARGSDGWIRNRPDGNVETFFGSKKAAVYEIVVACGRVAPVARMTDVITKPY